MTHINYRGFCTDLEIDLEIYLGKFTLALSENVLSLVTQNTNYLHSGALIYLATCEQASTRTDSKSLVNSGPFFLLFWMTSLARYRNVSFLLLLAETQFNKNVEEKTLACILNHLAINILLVSMSKMPIY